MATTKEVTRALCAMLNDLGRVDDSGLSADSGQNSEHLKKERDEKRAALYKYETCTCIEM